MAWCIYESPCHSRYRHKGLDPDLETFPDETPAGWTGGAFDATEGNLIAATIHKRVQFTCAEINSTGKREFKNSFWKIIK